MRMYGEEANMQMTTGSLLANGLPRVFKGVRFPNPLFLSVGLALLLVVTGLGAETQTVVEIAPGVFVRPGVQEVFSTHNQGRIANLGFIVGSERVAVIDTGSTYQEGMELRKMIGEITDLPIAYVILTHMHPDHALGAAAFNQDEPVFIGHEQLSEALATRRSVYLKRMRQILGSRAEGTEMVFPGQTVNVGQARRLDLGDRILRLRAFPTAHTNNDLTVYDEKTATLWLSDLLFVQRIPVVDGSLLGWQKVIDGIVSQACGVPPEVKPHSSSTQPEPDRHCLEVARIVPGHGPVVSHWKQALADQHRYLDRIADGIRKIINKGGTIPQAVESVGLEERGNWLLFDEFHGRNVTAVFAELEWE
jgi:quinoprotein relay system zinc metallohydrolase 2